MDTTIPLTVWKDGAGTHFVPTAAKVFRKFFPSEKIVNIEATTYGSKITVNEAGYRQVYEVLETPDEVKAAEDPSASNPWAKHLLNIGLDAAGSAQGAGVAANRYWNSIDAATDTSAEAVDIEVMDPTNNNVKILVNETAVALEVFPASGDNFRGKSANAVLDMAANSILVLFCVEADVIDYIVIS